MKDRPLVVKRYRDTQLAAGMRVVDGVYGHIEVRARYKGKQRLRRFPLDSPLIDRLYWQHQTLEALRLDVPLTGHTLREDATVYLSSLRGEHQRLQQIWLAYWLDYVGHLARPDVTLAHCVEFFRTVTPKARQGRDQGEFSAASKNKLRSALIAVWRYHDGPKHACPASDIPRWIERPRPREISPDIIRAVLAEMRDTKARAQLGLMFATGCRPAELRLLQPDDFILLTDPPTVHITGAKGGKDRDVMLPPFGVQYARDFLRHEAWTDTSGLVREMVAAAKRAGYNPWDTTTHPSGKRRLRITPYALRHAYAMNLRRAGADLQDIADALGHRNIQTTLKYQDALPAKQVALAQKMWAEVAG